MALKNLIPHTGKDSSSLFGLQGRINELFDGFFADIPTPSFASITRFPSISVSEGDKKITVKAELPSMDEKDIKIEINQDRLTISGEKKTELNESKETYHISELSYGRFSRSLVLPFNIEADKAKASFDKGVLTIEIEKPASESQSKTIPINK